MAARGNMVYTHPIQKPASHLGGARLPKSVAMAAYEVYSHVYGKQEAMVTGGCRGGFAVSEIIQFLYARSFPKEEWRSRVAEAGNGMENL